MAPLKPIEKEKGAHGRRAQDVLDHATKIAELLRKRSQLPSNLAQELDSIIKRSFPLSSSAGASLNQAEFESLGCTLWNAATNLLRDDENNSDQRIVPVLRVFAFLLLDTAQPPTSKRSKDRDRYRFRRIFKIALKACRFCLDKNELDLARKALEVASEYVSASKKDLPLVRISDDAHGDEEQRNAIRRLEIEFYLLQMTHAWKVGNFDAAEHHYKNLPISQLSISGRLAETAADLFYEAGKSLAKQKLNDPAIAWLERAISALDAIDPEDHGQDSGDLRLAVTSSLVQCLLQSNDSNAARRAEELADQLTITHELGNRMTVHLMYFNILLAHSPVRSDKLRDAVLRITNSAVLTEKTFKIMMHTIHRARKVSNAIACDALQHLMTKRLLGDLPRDGPEGDSYFEYIEKACVTYVHFVSSDSSADQSSIEGLQKTLDTVTEHGGRCLSAKATHAAQTLIWKASGASDPEIADQWCSLLRHPLFDSAGQINKARIGRKAMMMAMSRNDWEAAREAFYNMPDIVRNESLTRYLVFKLAVQSNDYDLAVESLNVVAKQAKNNHTHLYACVLEAQQSRMRTIAVAALRFVLDKEPSTTHLPALLRCTARLLIGELDPEGHNLHNIMPEIVQAFENAASSIAELKKRSGDNWRAEVQWWSKNSYNLALTWCEAMDPELLVNLLRACTMFIDSHPNDGGVMHESEVKNRKALCHFVSATASITAGRRAELGSEESLQAYVQARQQISAYDVLLPDVAEKDHNDFKAKTFELLKFDLECILQLRQWQELDATLQACINFQDVESWDSLADVVLIIRQNAQLELGDKTNDHMNRLLDRIINDTWQRDKDIEKASKWLRVCFSLNLSNGGSEFALKLLQQAAGMAKRGRDGRDATFPENELQWLATTAYNKAVDLLSGGTQVETMQWIDGALELARYAGDEGAFHANLSANRTKVLERLEGEGGRGG